MENMRNFMLISDFESENRFQFALIRSYLWSKHRSRMLRNYLEFYLVTGMPRPTRKLKAGKPVHFLASLESENIIPLIVL